MVTDFSSLKKNSGALFEKLNTKIKESSKPSWADEDEGFWKLTLDKAKNGFAVIRFLPPSAGEDYPYVTYWDHGFQGPGGWYFERSLTSIDKDDPVSDYNSKLWETGIEANKDIARKQKRRIHYVSNILVVNDPAEPSNNGKVFKFRYGKAIYNMIKYALSPSEEDMALDPDLKPLPVFDAWEGANFKLKSYLKEGWVSYDKSTFESPSPISDDDKVIKEIWEKQYPLKAELDESKYKSYDELQKRLTKVLKLKSVNSDGDVVPSSVAKEEDDIDRTIGKIDEIDDSIPFDTDDSSDDELAFFENLAKS